MMNTITEETIKENLAIAHRQQSADEKKFTHHFNHTTLPEDPTQMVLSSKSIQKQRLYIAFSQGLYPYQEDRTQCVMIRHLPDTSHQALAQNINECIMTLGEAYRNEQSGSTLSLFVIAKDYLITANVGDSRIMLVYPIKNEYVCQRITWDHKPYHEIELKRIKTSGGEVTHSDTYRLNGILAVSRTFGDSIVGKGLSYEPDITWTKTKNMKNAYVIACTDGITDALHEKEIATIFNQEENIEKIPFLIRQTAFAKGSPDNMSLILSPILTPKNDSNIILGFVADGHGGDSVSELLRNQLTKTLIKIIKKNYPNKKAPEIIPIFP